jgi:hypothetical protein
LKLSSAQFGRGILIAFELLLLSSLIVATRCANYRDVFLAGHVYFTDADCYARMTRVRMCAQHPGLIVRHHEFENYPAGTTPHTTAPLDYLILALSLPLRPFTAQALDLAGALISPLFALLTGRFLWWWLKRMRFRYRWLALILYAVSPILVHGTELGRPDHQSLLMLLVAVGICAEWEWKTQASTKSSVLSGTTWGLAIWISAYEPLVFLLLLLACQAIAWPARTIDLSERDSLRDRRYRWTSPIPSFFAKERRIGLVVFVAIIGLAILLERRVPGVAILTSSPIFRNWSHTIGELRPVSPLSPLWFRWAGYLLAIVPLLIWIGFWKRASRSLAVSVSQTSGSQDRQGATIPFFVVVLLMASYGLTVWQARWAYFFIITLIIVLPALFQPIRSSVIVWTVFILSIFPILREWDEKLWPNESELGRRVEARVESVLLRDLSFNLRSQEVRPFLTAWWLSPAIAYWSEQPGVAGSSHESLDGIADSARFFLARDSQKAREIVENHKVSWVVAYDADRTAAVSAVILGEQVPEHALCYILERAPAQAPRFLVFSAQNATAKLFRVAGASANTR